MNLSKTHLFVLIAIVITWSCGSSNQIHENSLLIGKVIKIDTLTVSDYEDSVNKRYPNFSKVSLVYFELSGKNSRDFFVVMDRNYDEHSCRHEFLVGKKYEFNVHSFKYTNQDQVAAVLRGKQYVPRCETIKVKDSIY